MVIASRPSKRRGEHSPPIGAASPRGLGADRLANLIDLSLPVRPLRGQMVLYHSEPGLLRRIVNIGDRYLVPRRDGRILVGSTEELVGFDKSNTSEGVEGLIDFAERLVPQLADSPVERTWAGLRPLAAARRPIMGAAPGLENLYLSTGHLRAGLTASPAAAEFMANLILNEPPKADLAHSAFSLKTIPCSLADSAEPRC